MTVIGSLRTSEYTWARPSGKVVSERVQMKTTMSISLVLKMVFTVNRPKKVVLENKYIYFYYLLLPQFPGSEWRQLNLVYVYYIALHISLSDIKENT